MTQALDPHATYITPRGRRCRWVPLGGKTRRAGWYYFEYLAPRPGRAVLEGFTLTSRNLHILRREEVPHASAR